MYKFVLVMRFADFKIYGLALVISDAEDEVFFIQLTPRHKVLFIEYLVRYG